MIIIIKLTIILILVRDNPKILNVTSLQLIVCLLNCIKTFLSFLILPIIHLFLDLDLLRKSHFLKARWYSVRRMPLLLFNRRLWLGLRLQ